MSDMWFSICNIKKYTIKDSFRQKREFPSWGEIVLMQVLVTFSSSNMQTRHVIYFLLSFHVLVYGTLSGCVWVFPFNFVKLIFLQLSPGIKQYSFIKLGVIIWASLLDAKPHKLHPCPFLFFFPFFNHRDISLHISLSASKKQNFIPPNCHLGFWIYFH